MTPKMSKPANAGAHSAGIFADMTVDGPVIGDLVVVIDRARNLPNRKTIGKQDPYCAARLGKEAKKTDTDRRGGQTPKWDQELRFTVHESPDYYKLKVSIFNDDRKTELIGEAWLDLKEVIVRGGGQHDGWHPLNCRDRLAGELRMEITYYDTREREEKPVERPQKQPRNVDADGSRPQKSRRRPLPQGPNSSAHSSHKTETSASTQPQSHPAAPSRRDPRDRNPPKQTSPDASERRPIDPYEHRHKMMIAHGLPFDPSNPKREHRVGYDGGPRPAPGQQGFSELEKLSYKNRGLQLPDLPSQPNSENNSQQPTTSQEKPFYGIDDHERAREAAESDHIEANKSAMPLPDRHLRHRDSGYSQAIPAAGSQVQQYWDAEGANYGHEPTYAKGVEISPSYSDQAANHSPPHQPFLAEDAPPAPPVHGFRAVDNSELFLPPQMPLSNQPDFSQRLALLNESDDFFQPPENLTQLTTRSDPIGPTQMTPHREYNHGHVQYHHTNQQGSLHRHSMQEMRRDAQPYPYDPHSTGIPSQVVGQRSVGNSYEYQHYHSPHNYSRDPRSGVDDPELFLNAGDLQYQANAPMTTTLPQQPGAMLGNREEQGQQLHSMPSIDEPGLVSFRSAPLYKPQAVSPRDSGPSETSSSTLRKGVARKSVSPSPTVRRPASPRLSEIAFSPDSFDVLNPQVTPRYSNEGYDDSMQRFQSHANNAPGSNDNSALYEAKGDSEAPIRDSGGRLIDPSDHLPASTWAPEPEPKQPLRVEAKLRFRGAIPMPESNPRAQRPDVELPKVRSSVQSAHLTEGSAAAEKRGTGRARLQKKVRVMMTGGARKNETKPRASDAPRNNEDTSTALQDIPNVNTAPPAPVELTAKELRDIEVYGAPVGGRPPPLPAKIPLGQENSSGNPMLGMDALSREMSSIDIGSGRERIKKTRFAPTLI